MLELGLLFGVFGVFICLLDWRQGIFIMAFAGIVQDPIRKVVEQQPVYLLLIVGVFFLATVLGGMMKTGRFPIAPIIRRYRVLGAPLLAFLFLFIVHLGWTMLRFKSIALAGVAVISYLVPIVAVALGYNLVSSNPDPLRLMRRFLAWYVALVVAAASGIALDYLGYSSPLFEQIGAGIVITDFGQTFRAYSGFFRSPEIAGWHIGAAICMLCCLWFLAKGRFSRVAIVILVPFLLGCALLTGRRKVVMLVVLFLGMFGTLVMTSRLKLKPIVTVLVVSIIVVSGLMIGNFFDLSTPEEQLNIYVRRTGTVFADAGERFQHLGLGSIAWSIRRNGFWGSGAGVASQGAQHFGGGASVVGGGGEGGLGKVAAEFGVPGLVITFWIMFAIAREGWRTMKEAYRFPISGRSLEFGLLAFIAANIPMFIVASQAYGDLFIILTLGLFGGFAAGLPLRLVPASPESSPPVPPRPVGRPLLPRRRDLLPAEGRPFRL